MPSFKQYALLFQIPSWIFCFFVTLAAYLVGAYVQPYCRAFSWTDATISMPYDHNETFPSWSLVPITIAPVFVYAAVLYFAPLRTSRHRRPLVSRILHYLGNEKKEANFDNQKEKDDLSQHHIPVATMPENMASPRLLFWLELVTWGFMQLQVTMVQMMFVEFAKVYAGRLRPDFLSRLEMYAYTPQNLPGSNASSVELVAYCNTVSNSNTVLSDGHKSFPSGHSSTSFAAMGMLVCFLWYRLRPLQSRSVFKCFLCLLPLYFSFLVAVSRTRNNRHHFADILAGGLVGFVAALLVVRLNLRTDPATEDWVLRDGIAHPEKEEEEGDAASSEATSLIRFQDSVQ